MENGETARDKILATNANFMMVVLQLGISYQLATSIYVIKYCTMVGSCFIIISLPFKFGVVT